MHILHASAVAFDGQAVVLTGSSGSGKSSLALELMALGGVLVSDDQVVVEARDTGVWLSAPSTLVHKIEARGLGLLRTPTQPAWAALVVNMDAVSKERMPPQRSITIVGETLPLVHKVESRSFAAMLCAYLKGGRLA